MRRVDTAQRNAKVKKKKEKKPHTHHKNTPAK